jgi:hypothetical protein
MQRNAEAMLAMAARLVDRDYPLHALSIALIFASR